MRILVVEDQKDLNEIIVRKLSRENYAVDSCANGEEALEYMEFAEYDAVILDIMLPKLTGLGVLKKIRKEGNKTPVLLLTALGTVEDRVAGLDAGADDYLVKPFDFEELTARIRAMIRRAGGRSDNVISAGDLLLDQDKRQVKRGDKEIVLTAREFDILEYLMLNRGKVLSRDKLSTHVWNYDYDGGSNVIDVYMHKLRKKIDENFEEKRIVTLKGVGYMVE